jgi:hypothetical protein
MGSHLIVLAGFEHWWGGHCFGARLTASLVPWIVILEIIAIDAFRESFAQRALRTTDTAFLATAAVLSILSIAINAVGAFSREAAIWNVNPNIDLKPERLWDWRRPQFLAPFIEPNGPFPRLPVDGLSVGGEDSASYLVIGRSGAREAFRWTDGTHATVRFSRPGPGPGVLEIDARPYLGGGKLSGQRLIVSMIIRDPDCALYAVAVPLNVLRSAATSFHGFRRIEEDRAEPNVSRFAAYLHPAPSHPSS